jgi:predicted HAD superfamily Cof-like phosphohydrolase
MGEPSAQIRLYVCPVCTLHMSIKEDVTQREDETTENIGKIQEPQQLEDGVDYEQKVIEGDMISASDEFDKFSSESQDQFFRMVNEVKQTVEQSINDWKIKKRKLVEDLAMKVAALPDVEKSRVAGYIAWGFFRQKVPIARRYVYKVLSKEYKNKNLSDAAQLNQKLKAQAGTYGKTTVNGTNYVYRDIDIYKPVSLRRLAKDLHKKVEELSAVKASDQVLSVRKENEGLKKQISSLIQQKEGLEQIINGLKEENAVLRSSQMVELQH